MSSARKTTRNTMKLIKEEDDMSYDGSNGSFIDSDEDCEYAPKKRRGTIANVEGAGRVQRRPTRVPNLKIQNRNALLARENRLRKKQMMEELESAAQEMENENKKLLKMMKLKDRKNEELIKEVRYLKSVIANRTDIVSVLKSLPKAISPAAKQSSKSLKAEVSSYASSDTLSISEEIDNGIEEIDPFLPSIIDDFLLSPDLDFAAEWDQILRQPFNYATDIPKLEVFSPAASPSSSSGISTEHNYSNYDEKILESIDKEHIEDDGAGVCVHINRGKVSLEFCAVCHNNATSSWIDGFN